MILSLKSPFSSAHFYAQELWDEAYNRETFGPCYTPYGHGHNYVLEVGFHIESDSVMQQKVYYAQLLKKLTDRLDHEHLNFVIPEFRVKVPTTENIALYFLENLKLSVEESKIAFLRLYEMDTLWTEIRL